LETPVESGKSVLNLGYQWECPASATAQYAPLESYSELLSGRVLASKGGVSVHPPDVAREGRSGRSVEWWVDDLSTPGYDAASTDGSPCGLR
jgi:hypothetical protein